MHQDELNGQREAAIWFRCDSVGKASTSKLGGLPNLPKSNGRDKAKTAHRCTSWRRSIYRDCLSTPDRARGFGGGQVRQGVGDH